MIKELTGVLKKLDSFVGKKHKEAERDGYHFDPQCEITLLGQISLMADEEISAKIGLKATMDLDAYFKGYNLIEKEFERLLNEIGLIYDKDSSLVWLPKESTYENFFKGNFVTCKKVSPIYVIASKAIKAPQKNKILVQEAILLLGDDLVKLIKKYGGDIQFFED